MLLRERKPNRIRNFDYSQSGYYFVTICVKNREEWFGKIINGKMVLNKFGKIANNVWLNIPIHYQNVILDEFVIMPNHIHGIIIIKQLHQTVGTGQCPVPTINKNIKYGLISKIINGFKNITTKKIRYVYGKPSFRWQRSFYDHIIRNEQSLFAIRQYIKDNPSKWNDDRNNPENLFR